MNLHLFRFTVSTQKLCSAELGLQTSEKCQQNN